MATIPLTVPELVGAHYLVALPVRISEPKAVAERRLGSLAPESEVGQHEVALARTLVERDLVHFEEVDASVLPPPDLLRIFGATDTDCAALGSAAQLLAVSCWLPPSVAATHEVVARTATLALVENAVGAIVVDAAIPRLVAIDHLRDDAGSTAMAFVRAVVVPVSAGERGSWLTTKGLGRWGLPELQVVDVPPQLADAWVSILSGLALALVERFHADLAAAVEEGRPPAILEIAEQVLVTRDHVARAYADASEQELEGRATVQLRWDPPTDPGEDAFLTVRPPDSYARSAGEFLAEVVDSLFAVSESTMGYLEPDDPGMAAAVATARSCLDVARRRLLAGELEHHRLLMVKWRLDVDDGSAEFPWMFVTDWSDPAWIAGSSAVDAHADPSIRVGRPVRVRAEDVVDWGLFVDGDGIVEGGWTNAYLQGDQPPPVPGGGPADEPRRLRLRRRRR
jgi:uncharacterized protein YegJ (DUF2314 family)